SANRTASAVAMLTTTAAPEARAVISPPAPLQQGAPPIIADSPAPRVPFVLPPKYARVELRGYHDEKGRLVGPQTIIQQVDAGGINPDAIDNWDRGYIPEANTVIPAGMGSPVMLTTQAPVSPDSDILANTSPEDIVITGYVKAEDEPVVQGLASQMNRLAHFDSNV